jgi:predicted Zn finger-like uncharacterized protein
MKFLCENCKAKYQIADDKVAGRTVKMKCRKCGNMIEVEASVTETSVAAKMPTEDGPRASTGVSATQGAVQAAASGTPPPRPLVPPPRPITGAMKAGGGPPVPAPLVRPTPHPDAAPESTSGLAGAFSKAVAAPPKEDPSSVSAAMAVLSSSSSTEEWYVGINGVPVGPVRLSELRRKAAGGAVTEDSLVWREGFEEWVPLRTFPELLAMLKESASSGRTSLTPAPPNVAPAPRSLGPPVGARTPSPAATRPSPTAPTPRPAVAASATARSNVVAISSRRATAEKIEGALEEDIKFESEPDPFPAPAPAPESAPLPSFDASAVSTAVMAPAQEVRHSKIAERIAESRKAHPALWIIAVLVGILVGMGVMILLLPNATNKPTVVQAPAAPTVSAAAAASTPTAAPSDNEGMTTIGPIEVSAAVTKGSSGGGTKGAKAADTSTTGGPAAPLSTSLTGLGGLVGGPSGPSGGSSQGSSGGGQLATADLERVVQSHRAFVKRQCWDSALAARAPNSPSSARVAVSITVGRDGNVQSASASGGDGYPGLSSCVQSQVRSWKFPVSDGPTTFSVPFVFAAQ